MWGEIMTKKISFLFIKNAVKIIIVLICFSGLLLFPRQAGEGIKDGLKTLYETIIPSLFPFMVLSSYIASASFVKSLSQKLNKASFLLFKINGNAIITLILSFLGGYPVGAKTACEFYEKGALSKNEVSRLLSFCVTPSLPFCVTAIGTFMLGNNKSGMILYLSSILSSITIGILLRFTGKSDIVFTETKQKDGKNEFIFINSVAKGNSAMLSVCGWVLIFSCICSVMKAMPFNRQTGVFISAIFEVTAGCKTLIDNYCKLPVLSALLSFGGLAVIFQVSPYLEKCRVSLKEFFCWRIINGALSCLYCYLFCKVFPDSTNTAVSFAVGCTSFTLSHSLLAGGICVLMCLVFIFEVDNKRKIC